MERAEILELVSKEYSNWEIDPKPLGNGSFGVVFQMVGRDSGERRALKVIPIPHDDSEIDRRLVRGYPESEIEKDYTTVKNRVLDEVLNIIQLRTNDNVINIFGYREIRRKERIGWIVCFDMEYLPPLIETKKLNEQQIVRMALDMCNALKSCHARKIVHRDIKPENILQKGDSYVLADFGVSKMANTQSSLSLRGTYDYMAPELIRQESYPDVSPDTVDIYSLGITLYVYANQNRLPLVESASDMMYQDKRDEMNMKRWNSDVIPAPSGVSERLSKIILCACEKDPRRRYQSAAEMEYDLLHLNTNDFLYCDRMKQLAEYSSKSVAVTPPPASQPMNNPAGNIPPRPQNAPMNQTMPVQRLQQTPPRVQQTPAQRGPQMQGNKTPYVPAQKTSQVPQGTVAVSQLMNQQLPSPTQKPVKRTPARGAYVPSGLNTDQPKTTTPGTPRSLQDDSGKSKKKKIVIGLTAGAVAVALAAVGISYIGFDSSETKKNSQMTTKTNSLPTQTTSDVWNTTKATTKATTKSTTQTLPAITTTTEAPPTTAEFSLPAGQTTSLLTYGSGSVEINLSAMSYEVPNFVKVFMEQNPDMASKYRVTCFVCSNSEFAYETKLNSSLVAGGSSAPDIYVAEADYVLPYTQGEFSRYAAPYDTFIENFNEKLQDAQIAQYTIDLGSSTNGKVLGLAYQCTGGAMIYSASIAREVFGSDDPAVVEAAVGGGSGSWDRFTEACAKLKSYGYAAVADVGDIWNVCDKAATTPWVIDGKLHIDPQRMYYFDLSKQIIDNNWSNNTGTWNSNWYDAMQGKSLNSATGQTRKVFAFFGPAWIVNYAIGSVSIDSSTGFGDWRVCTPPLGFWWGGSWLCVNKAASLNPDKREFISRFVEWVTLDTSTSGLQYLWATGALNSNGTKDCVSSYKVMNQLKGDMAILGGQDAFPVFIQGTRFASAKSVCLYDSALSGYFKYCAYDYLNGEMSKDDAINEFKQYCKSIGLQV